jgi:hypothetical protein
MSIQDERELRGRLGGLLDSIEPAPAPVASAMRRGKVIRMRRWVSAAAGVAVLAAGAVALPALIRGHHAAPPTAPRHYSVTVQALGPTAKGGVIGAGTINNKHWRIVLSKAFGDGCSPQPYVLMCGSNYGNAVGPRDVSLGAAGATTGTQFQFGNVGTDVTRVTIRLSNGAVLDLRPVSAYGHRWVAVATPALAIVEAESFVGASEYRHAIPYVANSFTEFVTWLRPGQPGVPRAARQLGSGEIDGVKWHISVDAGPWGYCTDFGNGGQSCIPSATSLQAAPIGKPLQLTCTRLFDSQSQKEIPASAGMATVPAGVKNVVLVLAHGSHLRLVAVPLGGVRVIGYAIANRPKVVRTLEYGFAGQLVASMSWADWGC